jgi:prepilin-type N-terminal cleavage/methylation domain-containing protein
MLSRLKNEEKGFTLIELIMVIVILGIIAAVAIPKFLDLAGEAKKAAARGFGGAMTSTIAIKYAGFQLGGPNYTLQDIVTETTFTGGISNDDFVVNADGSLITLDYRNLRFEWDYVRAEGEPGLLTEKEPFGGEIPAE